MNRLEILMHERDMTSERYVIADRRVERFQLFRVLLLLILSGLLFNHDFVRPKFQAVNEGFAFWRVAHTSEREWLLPLSTSGVMIESEAIRTAILHLKEVKTTLKDIPPQKKMSDVFSNLVKAVYKFGRVDGFFRQASQ